MLRFLFWNVNGKPREAIVANLAREHDVDVIALAECVIPIGRMQTTLYDRTGNVYHYPFTECRSLVIYTRFSGEFLIPLVEHPERLSIRRICLPGRPEILFCVMHGPSKLRWSASSQAQECQPLSRRIRECEGRVGHQRSVLVGDLNMNPLEEGVVSAAGLNAVMTREIASRGQRTVLGERYPFFYNPMWGRFGDTTEGPPGTYFYDASEQVSYFWNVFDQVLVRPALLERFPADEMEILTTDGETSFLTERGRPAVSVASDHLPVVFALDI